jgi:integrase
MKAILRPFRGVLRGFLSYLNKTQTLYSFRHSGAIEIFKRTGSITKLQKAMGHSSINVSLTYLRGLEIAELEEEDMPMV